MPPSTPEMDAWIFDLYGKHPADFLKGGQVPQAPAPPGSTPPPGSANTAPPPGQPPAPAPPPTPAQWSATNKAAMDKLNVAGQRVVMPGPGQVAQGRVNVARQAISAALGAGNLAAATAALTGAQADCATVMKEPDAAMLPVQKGQHPDQVLFAKESATDAQDIAVSDINQDGVGDCYLLSTLGEVARIKPDLIRNMVKDNGDGTYTVTLFRHKGGVSGFFVGLVGGNDLEPVKETVDGNFGSNVVDSQPGQAQAGGKHEIWVQVVEKAYAKLNGGYDKIDHGGWPMDAMEAVTGKKASKKPVAKLTVDELQADLAKGKPVVMDTMAQPNPNTLLPFGMYGPHAYMVDSIVGKGPNAVVILKNPWGNRHPLPIPFSQLGLSISVVDTGGSL